MASPSSPNKATSLEKTNHSAPLNCPRCGSYNTKFCYYNNYSLSQPRHLCKACKRYWTRGGTLRNIPACGGCRKNRKFNRRGSRSGDAAATANPRSQYPMDPPPAASIYANNHLFFGLESNPVELNFPISGVNQTRVSGLGFSSPDDLNQNGDGFRQIQTPSPQISASPGFDSVCFFGSTSFASSTRTMASLLVSSLQQQKESRQPGNGIPGLMVQTHGENGSGWSPNPMEQIISWDLLPWSTTDYNSQLNNWDNMGSSIPISRVSHSSEIKP